MYCVSLVLGKDAARLHDGSSGAAHAVLPCWGPGRRLISNRDVPGLVSTCGQRRNTNTKKMFYDDVKNEFQCVISSWTQPPFRKVTALPGVWHVLSRLHMMAKDFEYVAELFFHHDLQKNWNKKKSKSSILFKNNNLEFGLAADDFSFKLRNLFIFFVSLPPSIFCVTSGRYNTIKRGREREICT